MSLILLTIGAKHKAQSQLVRAGNRVIAGLFFLALSVWLSGCGLLSSGRLPQLPGVPEKATVSGVPFFAQEELQCGPAALAMVLNWSGIAVSPLDLAPEVYSPGLKGSLQSALVGAARRHGRIAYPLSGSEALLAEVAAGHPVVVLVNLGFFWYPKWHYAVVVGYDREVDEVILHSGRIANERLSSRVFLNIWQRSGYWGLLVMPPDRLPARGEEAGWLDAVAGLERVEQWPAAARGYAVALERWNQSFVAWMGLGNNLYKLQDLAGAAAAFRQATLLQPKNGMAFNNLAIVLAEQNLRQAALVAAQRAVALGGPLADKFRQTQAEIEGKGRESTQ